METYNKALHDLYDHVGFKEDWVVYPIDDCTDKYWYVNESTNEVHYGETQEDLKNQIDNYYVDEIYKQRFYDKWIYSGKKFTMIFCDPGVDGMKWFKIFDNDKMMEMTQPTTQSA
jgi:hypothetical protein